MKWKKRFCDELKKIPTPNLNQLFDQQENKIISKNAKKRITLIPALCIILSAVIVCTAAVYIPTAIIRKNARILAEENTQSIAVPEGYIGIFSIEDLDKIRSMPEADYILMNDLVFEDADYLEGGRYEGGWIPIGSENESNNGANQFVGIFNGNGHTIKNLRINTSSKVKQPYFGLFGDTSGHFINLGIESYTFDMTLDKELDSEYICVGSVAARAEFTGGCYVTDSNISISVNGYHSALNEQTSLCVGGICGISNYIDSCAVFADISVTGSGKLSVYAGLCAAQTFSAITSYTVGDISIDAQSFTNTSTDGVAITATEATMPIILSSSAMEAIREHIKNNQSNASNEFNENKFLSFYVKMEPLDGSSNAEYYRRVFEINAQFGYAYTNSENEAESLYILDRSAPSNEVKRINDLLCEIFGEKDALINFCMQNGIKCGMMNCYSFKYASEITLDTFFAFDFDSIWSISTGRIIPKVFVN